ncbi:MAG TPA: hypothetical protein VN829_10035 [Dongiaceae bacterium]|nr:hypothetical protein [Dongiaceae bacterium]
MPRIKTTRMVRIALWALRIYLLILLSLIGLKFARVFSGSRKHEGSSPGAQGVQTNPPPAGARQ